MFSVSRRVPSHRLFASTSTAFSQFRAFSRSFIPFNELAKPKKVLKKGKALKANKLPPRPTIDESEFIETFIKGGGPGGQKINKTNSKVQLKHIETGIVIDCQETRSREQNRTIARRKLALEIEALKNPEWNRKRALEEFNSLRASKDKKSHAKRSQKATSIRKKKLELEQQEREERDRMIDPEVDYELLEYLEPEEREKILAESRERMSKRLAEDELQSQNNDDLKQPTKQ